jgi:hypothetical protein
MKCRFNYADRKKQRCYSREPYRLSQDQWPEPLRTEFAAYTHWRTAGFVAGRPRQRRQREGTFQKTVIEFEAYFGYLVNVAGRERYSLRLKDICNSDWLSAYASWHAENRADGEPSRFIQKTLGDFLVVARHYLSVDNTTLQAMADLKTEVMPDTARDKRDRWNSLMTLERVGLAVYPNGARRFPNRIYVALAAQTSLIIRLLVRRPVRSRNIREMRLGRNLYRAAEGWMLHFQGEELKVSRRDGRENLYRISFPCDLEGELEEFLEKWRPLLNTHNSEFVFLSRKGIPLSQSALHKQIAKSTYEYTGRATNPHLIRHIWATEFIASTQRFTVAAAMLGDELETVLRRYSHLKILDAGQRADEFFTELLMKTGQHLSQYGIAVDKKPPQLMKEMDTSGFGG